MFVRVHEIRKARTFDLAYIPRLFRDMFDYVV